MEQTLYDTLRGNWNINRVIDDRRAQQSGIFRGTAVFSGDRSPLLYAEDGELALGAAKMRATRRYRWAFQDSHVIVTYEDGQPFHDFKVENAAATAEHLCGEDIYYAQYAFYLPDRWQTVWTVSGPRKDYTSTSLYSR